MTWIIKRTSDGRGGHISTSSYDLRTKSGWPLALKSVKMAAVYAGIFKGERGDLDPALLPKVFVVEKKRKVFPDMWWGESALLIISDALRRVIEAHDPGKHIIWPVEMLTKRGQPYPGPFFAFVPAVHAAAISESHSDVRISEERFSPATPVISAHTSPRFVHLNYSYDVGVLCKDIPDANLWWDHGLSFPQLLTSDALHDAIVAAGLKVIPMKRVMEIDD
ncbi:hypothetical protein SAMN04488526_3579 [Jannaschia helgolandensis]|uniref:Immunity MXAN-0049 protein domain-containing protein n=2 Tax=Jannaschia helgolandensis TaxID=188906 RepID=A0A1H7T7D6_9RHOB|nr:hypothetical protein SAMN04488526_3579 [Jannaschia helgolandensis]